MQGDNIVQLVVLCAEKPTQSLLRRVADELPVQLAKISTEHSYTVTVEESEGVVIVTDDQITVKVSLTSPVLREQHQHGKKLGSVGETVRRLNWREWRETDIRSLPNLIRNRQRPIRK